MASRAFYEKVGFSDMGGNPEHGYLIMKSGDLKAAGIELAEEADPDGEGPAHITLQDPDGNPILIDQHR